METISFSDGNDVVFKVTLSDSSYTFRMLWNQQGQYWSLSIPDVVSNIKVVCNYPLFNGYRYLEGIPTGDLVCVAIDESLQKPGRDSFTDGKCALIYAV